MNENNFLNIINQYKILNLDATGQNSNLSRIGGGSYIISNDVGANVFNLFIKNEKKISEN